ncbi:putative P3 [Cytorhabdovirus tiliae]|uniref:P3 n=1 Tax=Cytorhabdovirus sp. 'tiliae' TaxID=3004219 RepID=A0A9J7CFV1_9RHAB|nr:putative P3 [Cytorhabdovirus tiliae]
MASKKSVEPKSTFRQAVETIRLSSKKKEVLKYKVEKEYVATPRNFRFSPSVFHMLTQGWTTITDIYVSYQPAHMNLSGSLLIKFKDNRLRGIKNDLVILETPLHLQIDASVSHFPFCSVKNPGCYSMEWEITSPEVNHEAIIGELTVYPTYRYTYKLPSTRPAVVSSHIPGKSFYFSGGVTYKLADHEDARRLQSYQGATQI